MGAKNTNQGRYALITGATSGFGYEFAKIFANNGFNLVLVARNDDKLAELSADFAQTNLVDVGTISKDRFKPTSAEEIHAELNAKNITIDVLVNDAGQGEHGNFIEYDLARDIDMIQLNITSLESLTKLYLRDMVARNDGKILQVARGPHSHKGLKSKKILW